LLLDLKNIPESVAQYFIICEASNFNQVKAIGQQVIENLKLYCNESPYGQEGNQLYNWYLIDYIDLIIHIFLPETRQFYKLEEYWSDSIITEYT